MKYKSYPLLPFVALLSLTSCSDGDNDKEDVIVPEYTLGFVSRIKVYDVNNPADEVKTIKIYYDSKRRVTGVHWGTTVPERSAWKFVYENNKVNIISSYDPVNSERYCNIDAQGRAVDMVYKTSDNMFTTAYAYSDKHLVNLSENNDDKIISSTDFSWNMYGYTSAITKVKGMNKDSLTITSSVMYDEFSPNNTNIDFNVILNAIHGLIPQYNDAPILLELCGSNPTQLIVRHTMKYDYATDASRNAEYSYKVINCSMQQGRVVTLETESMIDGKHRKIDIIYKAD